ncbi:uncharacterized protein LOC142165376 [Nicotiana tabacum]|uniref:Uncharacterized protein LOC142165376 n=1 Tax=Nicotiana tabacum TaxID=4097 RepID=A0AC58S4Z3_TOBAC
MRIFQLHRAIATLSQGIDSVSIYFTKLKILWNEYDALTPTPNSKEYVEHLQQQRLLQFLSGLNDSYDQDRRQILLKSKEPTINQAYAMVIEDESYHALSLGSMSDKTDPIAMQVSKDQNYRGKKTFHQCEYCGLKGYTKEICYKIISYPKDFKRKKRFNTANNNGNQYGRGNGNPGGQFGRGTQQPFNAANNASTSAKGASRCDLHNTLATKVPYFTKEQYRKILGLLNKETGDNQANSQANMAGIKLGFSVLVKQSYSEEKQWTMSFTFLTSNSDLFTNRVKGTGREDTGLYIYKGIGDINKEEIHSFAVPTTKGDCNLWRMRLGHPSAGAIKIMGDAVFRELEFGFTSTPLADCPLVPNLSMQASQDLPLDPICISRDIVNNDLVEDHTLATNNPAEQVEETASQGEEALPEESQHDQHAVLTESLQD